MLMPGTVWSYPGVFINHERVFLTTTAVATQPVALSISLSPWKSQETWIKKGKEKLSLRRLLLLQQPLSHNVFFFPFQTKYTNGRLPRHHERNSSHERGLLTFGIEKSCHAVFALDDVEGGFETVADSAALQRTPIHQIGSAITTTTTTTMVRSNTSR